MRAVTSSLLALAICASPVLAAWPNQAALNLPVCRATGAQSSQKLVSDGAGGAFVTWTDERNGTSNRDIYAHHLLASGVMDPTWPVDGLAVCSQPNYQLASTMVADGMGGALLTWRDFRNGTDLDIYAQHLLASGVDPAWPADGVAICTAVGEQYYAFIVSDGSGGAIIPWMDLRNGLNYDIYAQHLLASGVVDPVWPADGRALSTAENSQQNPLLVSDNAGGAIVVWQDYRGGTSLDLYAQRILASGVVDPAWPTDGRALCTATGDQTSHQLAPDGAGGVLVSWQDMRNGNNDIYAAHVLQSGVLDLAWPADGRALCTQASSQTGPGIATDGGGGGYVAWNDSRAGANTAVYVQHVAANGIVDPAWPLDGRAIFAQAAAQQFPRLAPDGGGGILVTWQDNRSGVGYDIYAQHLLASASTDPIWPADGRAVCTAGADQTFAAALGDDAGGMMVAWLDNRNGSGAADVYAQRLARWGYLGTPEAEISSVKDVPNDNGGKLRLAWNASYLDAAMDANLGAYDVYRSVPPNVAALARAAGTLRTLRAGDLLPLDRSAPVVFAGAANGYAWEYVSSIPPNHFASQYSTLAPTEFDSISGSNPKTAFLVLARNTAGTMFWPSRPDTGYSVDNLPPYTPGSLLGQYQGGVAYLHWAKSTDADFAGYRVYRGTSAVFVPGVGNLVSAQPDTGCAVAGDANAYYKLSAVDTHGNESGYALLTPAATTGVGDRDGLRLALGTVRPNPTRGREVAVEFVLPRAGAARLELLDVAGRVVSAREVGSLGLGRHVVELASGARLAPGLYLLRLAQGADVRVGRVVVLD